MKKIKDCAVAFFNKHFVKWKFLQSIFVIPFQKDGKMYLHISQVCEDGTRHVLFLIRTRVARNAESIRFDQKFASNLSVTMSRGQSIIGHCWDRQDRLLM